MRSDTILIVEDERIIALDLQRRLEKFGYTVCGLVADGSESIEKARELVPDIILMDIMIAGELDGIEAAKRIKDELAIPVIFLTAYADEETLQRAKEAEPFGYILKPFKERELYTTIDIALYKNTIDEKLKQQERLFSAMLRSIGDGIIATDTHKKIRFLNPVAETLTGFKETEIKGKDIQEVFSLTDETTGGQIELPELYNENSESLPWYFEDVILHNKFGAGVHVEGSASIIRDREGKIEGQIYAFQDVTEIKQMTDTISYQASHDILTGLLNREEFAQKLSTALQTARASGEEHSLLYIDIDRFKIINDTCGHSAGDELIHQVTDIITKTVGEEAVLARLGGDEFGVLKKNTNVDDAYAIANRMLKTMNSQRFIWQKSIFSVGASIGIVQLDSESEGIQSILAAADDACYLAKEEGGNRARLYQGTDTRFVKRRGEMQWISRLTQALEEDRFVLYGQKIAPVSRDEERTKYELLIRLKDLEGNVVPPIDFIPAAERYHLMHSIDRWVIDTAMKNYEDINNRFGPELMVTINLSAGSITDESLIEFIMDRSARYAGAPKYFCFELTETAAIQNFTKAQKFITILKAEGFTFALDDFGTGFSSFSNLKRLPVDYLKIDGSFVKDIDADPINRALVESVNNIGHVFNLKTIAEFVKNERIMDKVTEIGVDYAQGYGIAKPIPFIN
ncbi:MAG: EAL domain-containing protein [Spirochaetia bacterium]